MLPVSVAPLLIVNVPVVVRPAARVVTWLEMVKLLKDVKFAGNALVPLNITVPVDGVNDPKCVTANLLHVSEDPEAIVNIPFAAPPPAAPKVTAFVTVRSVFALNVNAPVAFAVGLPNTRPKHFAPVMSRVKTALLLTITESPEAAIPAALHAFEVVTVIVAAWLFKIPKSINSNIMQAGFPTRFMIFLKFILPLRRMLIAFVIVLNMLSWQRRAHARNYTCTKYYLHNASIAKYWH